MENEAENEADQGKKDKKKKVEKKPEPAAKPAEIKTEPKPAEAPKTSSITTAPSEDDNKKKEKIEEQSAGKKDDKKKGGAKKPTGPSKLIKEALAKQKQAEEKIQHDEDEKRRKEEEIRKQKEEEERKEKERKRLKKLKEKERINKKKSEGTYLTKKEKEEKERAFLQLQALGVQIPTKAEAEAAADAAEKKAKPKYERLRKNKTQNQTSLITATNEDENEQKSLNGEIEKLTIEPNEVLVEVKDNWDEESDDEKKVANNNNKNANEHTDEENENDDEDEDNSEDEDESSEEESSESEDDSTLTAAEKVKLRIQKRNEEAEREKSINNLRAPVICVLGHVDTGKTKILDNLRRTHVQEDEAGGITQQIGATNVPYETIFERTKMCRHVYGNSLRLPGFLIIDTPGHEAFKSLRSRGSSLCDIAILVIDIMHGLEPQTIESLKLLVTKKTNFIVALNKVDRLFQWKTFPQLDITEALKNQQPNVLLEFDKRCKEIIVQLAEQGLNAALFYENPDPNEYISLVPTSAHTSDGTGNLIASIINTCQTTLAQRLAFSNELKCSVLEVKVIPSLGTTIDVCIVNGQLKVCDTIILAGQEGPIVTQIRGLLMPAANRDLRTKNSYLTQKELSGARSVKIAAKGLEKAMPGLPLFVAKKEDEIDYYKAEIQALLNDALSSIKLSDNGVFVQASTLGSLEALLEFLRTSKVPYAGINIGPVHKKDVTRTSIMLERDPQWAVILAFDVRVEREAQDLAEHLGVQIFTADIIYHLFDRFIGYQQELKRKKREEFKDIAVFPCKLKIMPEFIFNKRDPIVVGVRVESGFVKMGTPIIAYCEDSEEREFKDKFVDLGRITSIEFNHKQLEIAKAGQEVCIKIENTCGGAPKLLGRHFTEKDPLISKISRESIDAVKNYFREEMSKPDWQLIIDLKKLFQII